MGKNVGIVILILVIVAATVITVIRVAGPGERLGKTERDTTTVACVKCGAFEMKINAFLTAKEDEKTGYRKCPKCGNYSLAEAVKCMSCGQMVAAPPREYHQPPERVYEYKCPKCGQPVYKKGSG